VAKYLFQGKYTDQGLKGLLKDGGTKRQAVVAGAIQSLGGTLEAFYFAFGGTDVLGIADLPDNISASTFSLLITAAGGATVKTTVLLTPAEVDQAAKKVINYRPPGA
jgi:uncharacterized protein with GYD domain